MSEPKKLSLLEKLKQKAKSEKTYGGKRKEEDAKMEIRNCPNCGAGRTENDGLTHCGYCGFEFISSTLTDGINIKAKDNSFKNNKEQR